MDLLRIFLTVVVLGSISGSSLVEISKYVAESESLTGHPVLYELLNGPCNSYKNFFASRHGIESLSHADRDDLINYSFSEYVKNPEYRKDAENVYADNVCGNFSLIPSKEEFLNRISESETTFIIAAYIDEKTVENFHLQLINLLNNSDGYARSGFSRRFTDLLFKARQHVRSDDFVAQKNLEIIESSSLKLIEMSVFSQQLPEKRKNLSSYFAWMADEILSK